MLLWDNFLSRSRECTVADVALGKSWDLCRGGHRRPALDVEQAIMIDTVGLVRRDITVVPLGA
jgi:hypothetical protein